MLKVTTVIFWNISHLLLVESTDVWNPWPLRVNCFGKTHCSRCSCALKLKRLRHTLVFI